jgi:hypothetical protein
MTTFASKEDFDYYDVDCKAHADLKESLKGKLVPGEAPLMVYFESIFD